MLSRQQQKLTGILETSSLQSKAMDSQELPPSKLGTKDYWDDAYDVEINNFSDHGDIGDVWFGEGIMRKMVNWLCKNVSLDDPILDIGCGNGATLLELHDKGFKNLKGVDYSEKAVDLARLVADKHSAEGIVFERLDILADNSKSDETFTAILDKGTFDAISLNPECSFNDSREKYTRFIRKFLKSKGFFMMTSCNFTRDELIQHFAAPDLKETFLVLKDDIPTPTMTFGGKKGNNVTSLVFQMKSS